MIHEVSISSIKKNAINIVKALYPAHFIDGVPDEIGKQIVDNINKAKNESAVYRVLHDARNGKYNNL